jgi:hypothetical protein
MQRTLYLLIEGQMAYQTAYNFESDYPERRVCLQQTDQHLKDLSIIDDTVASIEDNLLEVLLQLVYLVLWVQGIILRLILFFIYQLLQKHLLPSETNWIELGFEKQHLNICYMAI